jgi:phthalate 4,5-dioxygenase oxygenase subunit
MLSAEDDARLTRVGPETPCGSLLRRYWLPFALSSELPEAEGAPVRVRLLGEDLIAYRTHTNSVGLVDAYCPHRRAPMFFARNEDGGLRCVYHGWKFDAAGACLDMPSEPPDSLFKSKVNIGAYPTWEGGGLLWAYLGPADAQPPPPDYEFVRAPATHRFVSKHVQDCNWLQALEGGLDSSHATIMHNMQIGDLSWLADYQRTVPKIDVEKTPFGYSYTGIRRVGGNQWVRLYQYIMPAIQMRGRIKGLLGGHSEYVNDGDVPTINGHLWVPVDDDTVAVYNFLYSSDPDLPVTPEFAHASEVRDGRDPARIRADFRCTLNASNDYGIDRALQNTSSFTGIDGINLQDVALQEGMGRCVDRTREHLGTTDRAIIVMRQLLLAAVRDVEEGRAPRGLDPATYRDVRALDHLVPADADWRSVLASEMLAKF